MVHSRIKLMSAWPARSTRPTTRLPINLLSQVVFRLTGRFSFLRSSLGVLIPRIFGLMSPRLVRFRRLLVVLAVLFLLLNFGVHGLASALILPSTVLALSWRIVLALPLFASGSIVIAPLLLMILVSNGSLVLLAWLSQMPFMVVVLGR